MAASQNSILYAAPPAGYCFGRSLSRSLASPSLLVFGVMIGLILLTVNLFNDELPAL
jgi:hypothetical protein